MSEDAANWRPVSQPRRKVGRLTVSSLQARKGCKVENGTEPQKKETQRISQIYHTDHGGVMWEDLASFRDVNRNPSAHRRYSVWFPQLIFNGCRNGWCTASEPSVGGTKVRVRFRFAVVLGDDCSCAQLFSPSGHLVYCSQKSKKSPSSSELKVIA